MEKKWKTALTSIIQHLGSEQYEQMLFSLESIPKMKKEKKSQNEMPQIIIQHLGLERSILTIKDIMGKIPRNDDDVQDLLRPFVEKIRNKRKAGDKRKPTRKPTPKKVKRKSKSESESEEDSEEETSQSHKVNARSSSQPWRQTVQELATGYLGSKVVIGKAIQKSEPIPYETQEKEQSVVFYVGFADETDAAKLTVYGRNFYDIIEEGHFYMLKGLLVDGHAVRVTRISKVTKMGHNTDITVPAHLEMKAERFIKQLWPELTIKEAMASQGKTEMTIRGIITEMTLEEEEKVGPETEKRITKLRKMTLQDETGSSTGICVCFWGDHVKQCSGVKVGDSVKVANVKSSEFNRTMQLYSTPQTQVHLVPVTSVQTGIINIMTIVKADKMETTLEAVFNQQIQTFVVQSKLLAKVCCVKLQGDIEERLLGELPLIAGVKIQGNKIIAIKKKKNA